MGEGRLTSENTANKSQLAGRSVKNAKCTSVRAACQSQLSFLFTLLTVDLVSRKPGEPQPNTAYLNFTYTER